MKLLPSLFRELSLLAALGLCAYLFPRTVFVLEAVCGVITIVLFRVERGMR